MQHIGHRQSLMLTKVEHLNHLWVAVFVEHGISLAIFLLSPDDTSSEVHVVVHLREICQRVHIVLQHLLFILVSTWGILIKLSHQHTIGSLSILISTVGFKILFHLSSAIELIGCSQVTALHLTEDGTSVNQTTP